MNILKRCGIVIPTAVKNSIEDVFLENDNVDEVICYHKEEASEFEKDLQVNNELNLIINNKHHGSITNVWTYYGEMVYHYSELYHLTDSNGNSIETISELDSNEPTSIINPNDWVISLFEVISWGTDDTKELSRKTTLYVYCPHEYEDF